MFVLKARHLMAAGLVSLTAWSAGAYAGAVEQLNAFVSNVTTARGEFVQRQVKGGTNGNPLRLAGTSSGDFSFSRPGRFVWRYVKPYEQQLSADGQTLYIYDKDLSQVTERKLDASLGSSPAAILFGSLPRTSRSRKAGRRTASTGLSSRPKPRTPSSSASPSVSAVVSCRGWSCVTLSGTPRC